MDHKTATYTTRTTRHWHKLFLCGGLLAALGMEECDLGLVSIESPADGTTFTEAQTVTITATALEGEGLTVQEVRFYRDSDEVGTDTTEPYAYRWNITDRDNGTHRFHAEALYRRSDGTTEPLRSEEVGYEVAIAGSPTPGPDPNWSGVLSSVDTGESNVRSIAFTDNSHAIVATGDKLLVYDVTSNVGSPRLIGSTSFGGDVLRSIAAHRGHVYVLGYTSGQPQQLHVVDLRVPSAPRTVRTIGVNDRSTGMLIEDGSQIVVEGDVLAFVGTKGLHVFDISDPSNPRGDVTAPGTEDAYSVQILNGLAYVITLAFNDSALAVVDVSNPARPVTRSTDENFRGVFLVAGGGALYTVSGGLPVRLDLSDPLKPKWDGWFHTGNVRQAVATTTHLYAARGRLGRRSSIQVFRLSNRDEPVSVVEDAGGVPMAMALHQGLLYLGDTWGTLTVIDP